MPQRGPKRPHMNETQFQEKILDLCRWLRLKAYHTFDSRRSAEGFPDLVIVGPSGTIFAELKSTTGKVSLAQQEWLDALQKSGERAYLWRPEDWAEVERVLKQLAEPRVG